MPDYSEEFRREVIEKLDRLDRAIRGNGKLGLVTRVDRLEQSESTRRRLTWIIVGAVVVQLIVVIGSKLTG
jgi:hypothetical protein